MSKPLRRTVVDLYHHHNENDVEHEKQLSLLNILKGFEEFTLDANGVIVSSNLEAINITGYEEWEVIGKKISLFYPVEEQLIGKPAEDLAKSAIRGSVVFTGLWMKKRSSSFLARIRITALKENGVVTGYKMILQDATYKAVNNQRIKRIKDEYLSLFNNSFVGIVKFKMNDFTVFMINEKAEKMVSGYNSREKLRFNEIFESQEEFALLINKLLETKKVEDFNFQLKSTNRWMMASLRYFPGEDFSEGILVDVTEVRKKDSELIRLTHELDQFIYHASHELRAPLASMLGIINLIRLENSGVTTHDYSKLLEKNILKLDSLLRNIVAISYNNKTVMACEFIDWRNLIDAAVKEKSVCLSVNNMQVTMDIVQTSEFYNDPYRLRIVLSNILSNALKYYNPNLEEPRVKIHVNSDDVAATITISDNGVGIDQKYLKNIFDMFYKAHSNSSDGHGLGLYIVKAIVERIGGTAVVESALGQGTVFKLSIPNFVAN